VALRIEGSFSIYGGHFEIRRVEDRRESEKRLKEEMERANGDLLGEE
jgi:hypothetical protein